MELLHPWPCVTRTSCPATISVPLRVDPFAARASYVTWPLPVPRAPSSTTSQSTSLRAVHVHCALLAVTMIVFRSPLALTESVRGMVKTHGTASCTIATCWLLTLIIPLRAA